MMEIKRLFAWAIIALPLFAACDNNDEVTIEDGDKPSTEVSLKNLVGEWVLDLSGNSESENRTLVINSDGSFVMENSFSYYNDGQRIISSQFRIEGKFKLIDKNLISDVTKAKQRFADWQDNQYVGMTDWEDMEDHQIADTAQISIIKDGSVLLMKSVYKDPYTPDMPAETICSFYFKKGSNINFNISELQGTWFWWDESGFTGKDEDVVRVAVKFDGDNHHAVPDIPVRVVRVAVKFDGDNIDLIVVPWGQRFICKYEYKNGVVTSKGEVTFRTVWKEHGSNPINYTNPYDSEWLPTYDPQQYQGNLVDGFSFPIIVDGKTAYSEFLGLSPIYQKQ